MKIKTPPHIYDNQTSPNVLGHIQAMTDDLRDVLAGGLSFYDKQLPFQIRSVNVISGQAVPLIMQAPYIIAGAYPILTNGAEIISSSSTLINGRYNITLTMNVNSAQIVFLMVGTNV